MDVLTINKAIAPYLKMCISTARTIMNLPRKGQVYFIPCTVRDAKIPPRNTVGDLHKIVVCWGSPLNIQYDTISTMINYLDDMLEDLLFLHLIWDSVLWRIFTKDGNNSGADSLSHLLDWYSSTLC